MIVQEQGNRINNFNKVLNCYEIEKLTKEEAINNVKKSQENIQDILRQNNINENGLNKKSIELKVE